MDKSNNTTKQNTGASVASQSLGDSSAEKDIPSTSKVSVAKGLESQPKMKTETMPSPSGTSKNHSFKTGNPPYHITFRIQSFINANLKGFASLFII